MTRVNVGIPPHLLCDQHLIAEYRELPRIYAHAVRLKDAGLPLRSFTLGKGHILCLVNRGAYLGARFRRICREMRCRGFNVKFDTWREFPDGMRNNYLMLELMTAIGIVRPRLIERLPKNARWTNRERPNWFYRSETVTMTKDTP